MIELHQVFAQTIPTTVLDPLGGNVTSLSNIFAFGLNMILGLGWGLVFIFTAVNINRYIISKGDLKELATLHNTFIWIVVGAGILFLITSMHDIILDMLGPIFVPGVTNFIESGGEGAGGEGCTVEPC